MRMTPKLDPAQPDHGDVNTEVVYGLSTTFGGTISGSGALIKTSAATSTLTGINSYVDPTMINEGALLVNGQITASQPVQVQSGGTLGGLGQVNDVVVATGGRVAPGITPGNLTTDGINLADGMLEIELNGLVPGVDYDQLTAAGPVALGGALDASAGFAPQPSNSFVIVNNTSGGGVSGNFAGLPEGTSFTAGGFLFGITYTGGDGNDVALNYLQASAPTLTIVPGLPGQAAISWSPNTPGFLLRETHGLSPANWVNSPSRTNNPVNMPVSGDTSFYRLFRP